MFLTACFNTAIHRDKTKVQQNPPPLSVPPPSASADYFVYLSFFLSWAIFYYILTCTVSYKIHNMLCFWPQHKICSQIRGRYILRNPLCSINLISFYQSLSSAALHRSCLLKTGTKSSFLGGINDFMSLCFQHVCTFLHLNSSTGLFCLRDCSYTCSSLQTAHVCLLMHCHQHNFYTSNTFKNSHNGMMSCGVWWRSIGYHGHCYKPSDSCRRILVQWVLPLILSVIFVSVRIASLLFFLQMMWYCWIHKSVIFSKLWGNLQNTEWT